MISRKIIIISISIIALVLATAVLIAPSNVHGQMTIPTRTPKPDPTDDSGGGDNGGGDNGGGDNGGGGDNQSQPTSEPAATDSQPAAPTVPPKTISTNTPPPAAPVSTTTTPVVPIPPTFTPGAAVPGVSTNTPVPPTPAPLESILPGTIIRFPAGDEPFPEAEPCGKPPTFTANDAISAHDGPSADYPLIGLLGAADVRPIVGRAAFTHWWVIQLERNGRMGWVNNEQGTVHGLASRVPIVSAPDLDGVTQTPAGTPWIPPTPQANCPAPELLAAAAAVDDTGDSSSAASNSGSEDDSVAGAGNEQTAATIEESPPSSKPDSLDNLAEIDQPAAEIGEKAPLVQTSNDSFDIDPKAATSARSNEADLLVNELAESASPLTLPGTVLPQLSDLMPVAATVLVLLAVVFGLFAKRIRPRGGND